MLVSLHFACRCVGSRLGNTVIPEALIRGHYFISSALIRTTSCDSNPSPLHSIQEFIGVPFGPFLTMDNLAGFVDEQGVQTVINNIIFGEYRDSELAKQVF